MFKAEWQIQRIVWARVTNTRQLIAEDGSHLIRERLNFIWDGSHLIWERLNFIWDGSHIIRERLNFIWGGSHIIRENDYDGHAPLVMAITLHTAW